MLTALTGQPHTQAGAAAHSRASNTLPTHIPIICTLPAALGSMHQLKTALNAGTTVTLWSHIARNWCDCGRTDPRTPGTSWDRTYTYSRSYGGSVVLLWLSKTCETPQWPETGTWVGGDSAPTVPDKTCCCGVQHWCCSCKEVIHNDSINQSHARCINHLLCDLADSTCCPPCVAVGKQEATTYK